jgi:hypothetical protein
MNILARILSHGFAIAVVLLIAVGLINRGELFPDMPLPGFLGFERQGAAQPDAATAPGTAATDAEAEAAASADEATEAAMPATADAGGTEVPAVAGEADTSELAAGVVDEVPAGGETDAVAEPDAAIPAPTSQEVPEPAAEAEIPPPPMVAPGSGEAVTESAEQERAVESAAPVATTDVEDTTAGSVADTGTAAEIATPAVEATSMEPPASPAEPASREPVAPAVTPPPETEAEPAPSAPAYAAETAAPASGDQPAAAVIPAPEEAPEAPAMDAAPAAEPAADAALDMTRPYHVLAAAREAYWMRNNEEAESLYRQLIDMNPDDPDGYGELGNLYFSLGRWDDAALAYFEAGSRLARTGHIMEAENLLEVIRGLESSQADELAGIIAESR